MFTISGVDNCFEDSSEVGLMSKVMTHEYNVQGITPDK
jgi:hypothetical protein